MREPPNKRVQRTRVARCARPGSPLTRHPLGHGRAFSTIVVVAALLLTGMAKKGEIVWSKPGEIRLVVVDRESVPIPGTTVTLSKVGNDQSQAVVISDKVGRASFSGVLPGDYVLRFELSGFVTCSLGPFRMRSTSEEDPVLPEFVVMMNPILVY